MKLLIALTATTLTLFAAASSAGAAGRPDGRWGGVQPNPRLWSAPDGAVGRWRVKPTLPTLAIGRI